jgi:repressor LexA
MMNDRARQILGYMERFTTDHGFPPTIREIGREFAIRSTNGVRYYLNLLERAGHINRSKKVSRAIVVTRSSRRSGIPVLGRVAAGQPILAEGNFEGTVNAEVLFGRTDELFALRVRGDSMIDAGILDGDHVIVRSRDKASPGEMIVALIDDEATVKYYRPAEDHIELVAANSAYRPIRVAAGEEFRIAGVVVGVMRTVGHDRPGR